MPSLPQSRRRDISRTRSIHGQTRRAVAIEASLRRDGALIRLKRRKFAGSRLSKPLFIARISPNGRQHIMQTGKIGRQFRAEPQDFSGNGVFDRQYIGMQGLSAKGRQRALRRLRQKRRFGPKSRSVNLIAHQGMTDRGQMDPDLMGPAGFEPASQQAARPALPAGIALLAAIALQHLPMRHRLPPAFANRHASRAIWCRSIGRSMVPRGRSGAPQTKAR